MRNGWGVAFCLTPPAAPLGCGDSAQSPQLFLLHLCQLQRCDTSGRLPCPLRALHCSILLGGWGALINHWIHNQGVYFPMGPSAALLVLLELIHRHRDGWLLFAQRYLTFISPGAVLLLSGGVGSGPVFICGATA